MSAIRERTGEGRKRAMKEGVKFGRKPKLSDFQRKEALKRRAAGETLAEIAKSYAVDVGLRMTAEGSAQIGWELGRAPYRHGA